MGRVLRLAAAGVVGATVGLGAYIVLGATGGPEEITASASAGLKLVKVGSFSQPVYVTAPPGDRRRLYVVEREGRIRVLRDGKATTFLDLRSKVESSGSEQGLLSMAFAPDYATSKRFYVYFTDRSGDQRIVEYRAASAARADAGSARVVMVMADSESNHNGGLLLFGPDGLLYVGTGDGGGGGDQHGAHGNAQNLASPLGKILRIDPRAAGGRPYAVPGSNPFWSRAGARPEVYAYGLRNPWRFSFDRKTDDLSIGDVGQDEFEEVDFAPRGEAKGANFGWRVFEGRARYASGESAAGARKPKVVLRHADGNCSITGGVVVRDRAVRAAYGRYLFADFCAGKVLSTKLRVTGTPAPRATGLQVPSPSSFGEDARGRVYITSLEGAVYRLAAK
jgi:glucose/arabinose dehydrogenase